MIKRQAGVTLMELMVVIAIIGILAAITTPNLISWRLDRHYNDALQQSIAILNNTKTEAIKRNTIVTIEFDVANGNITAFIDQNGSVQNLRSYDLGPGVRITNTTFGNNRLGFNDRGIPVDPQDESFTSGRITLESDRGRSNPIEVSMAGRIRLQ